MWFGGVRDIESIALPGGSRLLSLRNEVDDFHYQAALARFGQEPHYSPVTALDGCDVYTLQITGLGLLGHCPKRAVPLVLIHASASTNTLQRSELVGLELAAVWRGGWPALHVLSATTFLINRACEKAAYPLLFNTESGRQSVALTTRCSQQITLSQPEMPALYSLAASGTQLQVVAWLGFAPSVRATLPIDESSLRGAGLSVTRRGDVMLIIELAATREFSLMRSSDGGRSFAKLTLPVAARGLSFADERGLLLDSQSHAYETLDAGTTWRQVESPAAARPWIVHCVPEGCRLSNGFRMGWSAH